MARLAFWNVEEEGSEGRLGGGERDGEAREGGSKGVLERGNLVPKEFLQEAPWKRGWNGGREATKDGRTEGSDRIEGKMEAASFLSANRKEKLAKDSNHKC